MAMGRTIPSIPYWCAPVKLNYFKVFNRWGNLVFQTNDATPANGWNGKYNGTNQPAGTYTWIAEAVDADGNIIKRSGNILLIR
jgi:gliding motility-associated-like protein